MILVTAAEMRALDRWTIEEHGTAGHVLMERAGAGATAVLRRRLWRRGQRVVVVCGRGNNGGDGFVVARLLRRARVPVEVWLAAEAGAVRGDAARMLRAWTAGGGAIEPLRTGRDVTRLQARLGEPAVVVDALLGTGLNAPVEGHLARVIEAINGAGCPVLALDIPSGLSADTGLPLGVAIRAQATATFGNLKVGMALVPGLDTCGTIDVVDIGIPAAAFAAVDPSGALLEASMLTAWLPARPAVSHKGTYGHVLVVAGSAGKIGAALLATEAAARAGAGLVTLALPGSLAPYATGHVREAMTVALPDDGAGGVTLGDGGTLREASEGKAAVVCGPGLGTGDGARAVVMRLVRSVVGPLVLDADALNVLGGARGLVRRPGSTILTPHPGEMARLVGSTAGAVQADRVGVARALARMAKAVVVLKGARTVIADSDGRYRVNPTGNPGLATGGTGDVLAGVIGGLLAQGVAPFDAASLGVAAHGIAGDIVARDRGMRGMMAGDVCAALPGAWRMIEGAHA